MKVFVLAEQWYWMLLIAVCCYVLGSISAARIIARTKNKDITKEGSGNPGSMNMARTFGFKVGLFTFLFDAIKGIVPAVICHLIYKNYYLEGTQIIASDYMRYACGIFVILGHIYPVFSHFKGGKGIAPALGVFWANLTCESGWLFPVVVVMFVALLMYIYFFEFGSMASLMGVGLFGVIQGIFFFTHYGMLASPWLIACYVNILFIFAITHYAHHKNIRCLFSGEEHRTHLKQMWTKKKK